MDNANVETAPSELTRGILRFLTALGENDVPAAADHIAGVSSRPISDSQRTRLRNGYIELYKDFAETTVGEVSLTEKMMDTVKLAVDCGVTFPKQAFPLIKSLMTLDGIVRDCAPDAVLLRDTHKFGSDLEAMWEQS